MLQAVALRGYQTGQVTFYIFCAKAFQLMPFISSSSSNANVIRD